MPKRVILLTKHCPTHPRLGFTLVAICIVVSCASLVVAGLFGLWHGVSVASQSSQVSLSDACLLAAATTGFTLIEMSVVLVIIGLTVGGILVGRDLIAAAQIRSQIAQIDKFKSALNTFRIKYNTFPGDMDSATAAQLGLTARNYASDAALVTQQPNDNAIGPVGLSVLGGEQTLFWADLASAGLIPGNFTYASGVASYNDTASGGALSTDLVAPKAVLGNHAFVMQSLHSNNEPYVSGHLPANPTQSPYLSLSPAPVWSATVYPAALTITSFQAYAMDNKVDDGQALTGSVVAQGFVPNWYGDWAYSLDNGLPSYSGSGFDQNIPNSPQFCYNNNNNSASTLNNPGAMVYTRANIAACVMSFKAQ